MPGTFAHMTLVNVLCTESLDAISGLTRATKDALETYLNYCELGSTSPDYPSLTIFDKGAANWANVMHYYRTADLIRDSITYLNQHPHSDTVAGQKCVAWLFGYAAHVVADLSVHPVIAMKVGCYEGHESAHRRCELHQDVYIFNKILHEDVCSAEYLRNAGIMTCTVDGVFDPVITEFWLGVLNALSRQEIGLRLGPKSPDGNPDPAEWHTWFTRLVDGVAEEGGRLPALVRRLGEEEVLLYPALNEVDPTYINELTTPAGEAISYDAVFDRARKNIMHYWGELGAALEQRNCELFTLPNADLDTGAEDAPIFWRTA